uniref:Uncharacterized protein n=1 Tax=Chromera velia CCMP2878 TaxID=1169474 RepID=A0A0G4HV31_9ALVE|eukprot:Cvel_8752.t1-p1 / transcript=Cvel_8752.t1 / gene=Cvel_8752 / organism=Chromera_velia_CCMP2878 / gene_product=hypothetical protein / transcript_product=hypothetical protein / location=Cvel_scaffold489:58788-62608(-) / protein_length=384 / sequence_SO=supercontig / SO=protein_coding / is_pseudo=false
MQKIVAVYRMIECGSMEDHASLSAPPSRSFGPLPRSVTDEDAPLSLAPHPDPIFPTGSGVPKMKHPLVVHPRSRSVTDEDAPLTLASHPGPVFPTGSGVAKIKVGRKETEKGKSEEGIGGRGKTGKKKKAQKTENQGGEDLDSEARAKKTKKTTQQPNASPSSVDARSGVGEGTNGALVDGLRSISALSGSSARASPRRIVFVRQQKVQEQLKKRKTKEDKEEEEEASEKGLEHKYSQGAKLFLRWGGQKKEVNANPPLMTILGGGRGDRERACSLLWKAGQMVQQGIEGSFQANRTRKEMTEEVDADHYQHILYGDFPCPRRHFCHHAHHPGRSTSSFRTDQRVFSLRTAWWNRDDPQPGCLAPSWSPWLLFTKSWAGIPREL